MIHKINRDLYFGYRNRRGLRLRKGRTDNLSKAGWNCGSMATTDGKGRPIWVVAAEREDAGRFIVHADQELPAFLELESAIHSRCELS